MRCTLSLVFIMISAMPSLRGDLAAQPSSEPPPQIISYQGILTDEDGSRVEGMRDFVFRFFHADEGGSPLSGELAFGNVPVSGGIFSVELDATGIDFSRAVWLEAAVAGRSGEKPATLLPRTRLTAVPYAFHALNVGEAGTGWGLTGNSGTAPGTNYIGTKDNTSFELRVNDGRALLIVPGGADGAGAPNLTGGGAANTIGDADVGSTIGGGEANAAEGGYATIAGGYGNRALAGSAAIAGGFANAARSEFSAVGGGTGNLVLANFGVVAGGRENASYGEAGTVAGGRQNSAYAPYSAVGGGLLNQAGLDSENGMYATVTGGYENRALDEGASVGGGTANEAVENHATIGGGSRNAASGGGSTIAGGVGNSASGASASIGGGHGNVAAGEFSTAAGGSGNRAGLNFSTVAGGFNNIANGNASAVGGGEGNLAGGEFAVLGGGLGNSVGTPEGGGDYAVVGGGKSNTAFDNLAVVSGGDGNIARGTLSAVGGGLNNGTNATAATIGGGSTNVAGGEYSTIAGGRQNRTFLEHGAIGGGLNNIASGSGAVVTGGSDNLAAGHHAAVGGGSANQALDDAGNADAVRFAVIAGGSENRVTGAGAAIGGGVRNRARSFGAVAGGENNEAYGFYATVAGGENNDASGSRAAIGGGSGNVAGGDWATIPGGLDNRADGFFSFAAGRRAQALHGGSFVWSDDSDSIYVSTGQNQYLIRARGGVGIRTSAPRTQLHVTASSNSSASIENHVALIENDATTTTNGPDVLALKTSAASPDARTNFITFFNGSDDAVGTIEGTSSGAGVTLKSGGADFAEMLPRLIAAESISAGDVVGVFSGHVTKRTTGADQILVISSRPIVLGNAASDDVQDSHEAVAFIGQTEVRVIGAVVTGDLIVASGRGDGTARALTPERYDPTADGLVIGRAWGSDSNKEEKRVNVAVGVDQTGALLGLLERRQSEMDLLRDEIRQLRRFVEIRLPHRCGGGASERTSIQSVMTPHLED